MSVDLSEFDPGEVWAYRLRDSAPSERVLVRALVPKKTRASSRIEVDFLDEDNLVVRTEQVPVGRLRVPWIEVGAFDQRMADWDRIDDTVLSDAEQGAMWTVFEKLIPEAVAETGWDSVRDHLRIHAPHRLPEVGIELPAITDQVEWFADGDDIVTSPTGAMLLAEAACAANPMPILDWVIAEETELREKCKRGSKRRNLEGREETSSPEWEYYWYLKQHRPVHEIIRQWCGYRAVTFQERLTAAEAENQRLDILLARAIDALKEADRSIIAEVLETEHEHERITPERARPIVERPLSPHEMPVRHVTQPRRWGY